MAKFLICETVFWEGQKHCPMSEKIVKFLLGSTYLLKTLTLLNFIGTY